MSGNGVELPSLWEWTSGRYDGDIYVLRVGCWSYSPSDTRSCLLYLLRQEDPFLSDSERRG